MAFDINQIVKIVARIGGSGIGFSNYGLMLLLASNANLKTGALTWAVNTSKNFTKASDILDYYDSDSEAYAALEMYFSVTPKPISIKVWLYDSANDSLVEALAKAEDATWFKWFDVTANLRATKSDYLTLQSWGNTNAKIFAGTSNDAEIIDNAVSDDVVSQMVGAGARYSFIEYHNSNKYAGMQTAALYSRVNYSGDNTAITAFGKRKPGLTALDLGNTAYATLKSKGAVFYTKVEAGEHIDNGRLLNPLTTSSFGETIEDVIDADACVNFAQVEVYNFMMNTTTKVPQTPRGQQGAIDKAGHAFEQFYRNGFLGPREYTDNETGETKIAEHGYVILTKPEDIYLLSDADRAAHKLYPLSVRLFKAGAAFEINATLDVE